jgi:hypothetical protein
MIKMALPFTLITCLIWSRVRSRSDSEDGPWHWTDIFNDASIERYISNSGDKWGVCLVTLYRSFPTIAHDKDNYHSRLWIYQDKLFGRHVGGDDIKIWTRIYSGITGFLVLTVVLIAVQGASNPEDYRAALLDNWLHQSSNVPKSCLHYFEIKYMELVRELHAHWNDEVPYLQLTLKDLARAVEHVLRSLDIYIFDPKDLQVFLAAAVQFLEPFRAS